VTPIQVNVMTSIIANEGKMCKPYIINSKFSRLPVGPRQRRWQIPNSKFQVEECKDLRLGSETLRVVKEGMKGACAPGGTAFPLFNFSPGGLPRQGGVACKTGTAEFGDPAGRTHAWLTAFAPADDPQIVVTVLVEAGGEGSRVAAPIVKRF